MTSRSWDFFPPPFEGKLGDATIFKHHRMLKKLAKSEIWWLIHVFQASQNNQWVFQQKRGLFSRNLLLLLTMARRVMFFSIFSFGFNGQCRIYVTWSVPLHVSDQIIATSHDLTSNGGLVRDIPLFQGNLGWWNIIIWPDVSLAMQRD